jgi:hypothetical protein
VTRRSPVIASMKVVLPAPLGHDQPQQLAQLDRQADVVERVDAAEADGHALRVEHRRHALTLFQA